MRPHSRLNLHTPNVSFQETLHQKLVANAMTARAQADLQPHFSSQHILERRCTTGVHFTASSRSRFGS
jgi:hypothetical protein